ncbi:adenylate/guanylate cyclase domain-containing protein [Hymenobacter metallicola]|uniref:Adenylate/guanylate cyclase domain-containing protein n=1 Tax=Hymenobacter metallicola TaxID=2563114 RepID=A0A4Z0PY93_9BACT|nr:adenylate/guanylate cyclase domain-containing protein [Hymenobacter metallicola]TGE22750.1 adenylate/guanylate cyclase domain-containing protein [Hymenobacter metallicola]
MPTSRTMLAARSARFWAARRHALHTIGLLGSAFVGILLAMALLLWVPTRALLPLAVVGLPIGWALGALEVLVFPALVQRLPLRLATVLQGVGHGLLLLLLYGSFRLIARHVGVAHLWTEPASAAAEPWRQLVLLPIVYALAVWVTTLLRQLLQGMSSRRLRELIRGRYQQPATEARIFLFVDLKDSTPLAERLGNDRYSHLISDFFRDVSPAIAATRGEVYQYVGDEVVISWPAATGQHYANCLHCFFEMQRAITARHAAYQAAYGVVPSFKAGAHGGLVTTVLVGTQHREVVYHGDVLNTTARIQAQCNALGSRFLISAALRQQLGEQPEFQFMALGGHALRGKAGATELFDVQLYLPLL